MASLMWHKTHKSGASKGDLYTLPAAEALRPHKAAERPCRYQEARRTTAPGEDTETGKRRETGGNAWLTALRQPSHYRPNP
jgi:hypothetical protein